ncbi:MAG TPA: VapC toxin family PIN domain ribonuclease [Opitutaceae bacterium]|nr:VapC toxin family PIN domain ribonuclease [Opitutaceae bacterium]HRJ47807.1 VapC toxin family PIN domain ribonuclease [Opitutaceae bacterium]
MKYLLDNDVFLAAISKGHDNHKTARRWLDAVKPDGWGVAAETYLAAVRLLMNPTAMQFGHLTAAQALQAVDMELAGPQHPGQVILSRTRPDQTLLKQAKGHRQVMDFWLIQIARENGCLLATNDAGLVAAWPKLAMRIG